MPQHHEAFDLSSSPPVVRGARPCLFAERRRGRPGRCDSRRRVTATGTGGFAGGLRTPASACRTGAEKTCHRDEHDAHTPDHPIAVRKGMQLFDEGESPLSFALISSQTFKTGVLSLVYAQAEPAGSASYEDAVERGLSA